MALASAAVGAQIGAEIGLRALALVRESLRARIWTTLLLVAGGVVGARLAGGVGTAWGLVVAESVGAATWWFLLTRALRSSLESPPDPWAREASPPPKDPVT